MKFIEPRRLFGFVASMRGWQPKALIITFSSAFIITSVITSILGYTRKILVLDENQTLYLFSTSAQVLAAIYGLTLTGFIFFRNELSREEFEDDTLSEVVESLKRRYFVLLLFITILVLITLGLANVAIVDEFGPRSYLSPIFINFGQSAYATSLIAIAYFIFDVIYPRRIEITSQALQKKMDRNYSKESRGGLEEFLKNYNEIESLLIKYGEFQSVADRASYSKGPRPRMSNARLAEMLARNDLIDQLFFKKLRNLITLRNSIIHGADPVVSPEMVAMSKKILSDLKAALNLKD